MEFYLEEWLWQKNTIDVGQEKLKRVPLDYTTTKLF